jgi:hypothetical protein
LFKITSVDEKSRRTAFANQASHNYALAARPQMRISPGRVEGFVVRLLEESNAYPVQFRVRQHGFDDVFTGKIVFIATTEVGIKKAKISTGSQGFG